LAQAPQSGSSFWWLGKVVSNIEACDSSIGAIVQLAMTRALSVLTLAVAAAPDVALAASLCMEVPDLNIQRGSGGPVQVWYCLKSDNPALNAHQQWFVQAYTGAPQRISSQALSWLCLDLAGGDTTNGNAVRVLECSGSESQQWVFGNDNHIRYFAAQGKCVDAGDMLQGTQLTIQDCNGLSQQNWGYDSGGIEGTIYLSDSRRLQVPAPGRLRGARNASAAASNLAAAAASAAARAPRSSPEQRVQVGMPHAERATEQRSPVHNLTSSPCPVNPSARSCNPGDAGKSFSFEAVCDCQFDSFCQASCPAPHPADCWICTGGGCSGGGLGSGFEAAVARAYPGCQPCNVPNGGGFDWKLYATEDHHC